MSAEAFPMKPDSRPPVYTLNGKPIQFDSSPPSAERLRAYLKALPDGELIDNSQAAAIAKLRIRSLEEICAREDFKPHRILLTVNHARRRVWGNAHTIAELERRNEGMRS
jgi:hypothetical protein